MARTRTPGIRVVFLTNANDHNGLDNLARAIVTIDNGNRKLVK